MSMQFYFLTQAIAVYINVHIFTLMIWHLSWREVLQETASSHRYIPHYLEIIILSKSKLDHAERGGKNGLRKKIGLLS